MSALTQQEILYEMEHIGDNKGPSLIAAYAVCISLAYVAVFLRFISRRIGKNALLADDWMVVVALVRHSAIEEAVHATNSVILSFSPLGRLHWVYLV